MQTLTLYVSLNISHEDYWSKKGSVSGNICFVPKHSRVASGITSVLTFFLAWILVMCYVELQGSQRVHILCLK